MKERTDSCLHRASIKGVVAPRGHEATEERGELPAIFKRNGYSCELASTFGPTWMVGLVSVLFALAVATLWMSVYPYS